VSITRVYFLMQPPPETIIPADSTPQDGTFDTQFKAGFAGDDSLQVTFHLTSFRLTVSSASAVHICVTGLGGTSGYYN
jgi:hypothetical protein